MTFPRSYLLWSLEQSSVPSLGQGYVVLAVISTMDTSDSPAWLPFPFHGTAAYRVGYCWRHQQTRWGLPSSQVNYPDIPLPIHRRVLRRCSSKSFTPSLVFARPRQARLPLVGFDDAAGFTLCYGLPSCDDIASTLGSLLTPDGHYGAAWPLPRPDFHRLVDLSFAGHAAIQTPLESLTPLRTLKTLRGAPSSVVSVLFSAVSDSRAYKTPAVGHARARPWLASGLGAMWVGLDRHHQRRALAPYLGRILGLSVRPSSRRSPLPIRCG